MIITDWKGYAVLITKEGYSYSTIPTIGAIHIPKGEAVVNMEMVALSNDQD